MLGSHWERGEQSVMQKAEHVLDTARVYAGIVHRQFFVPHMFEQPNLPNRVI